MRMPNKDRVTFIPQVWPTQNNTSATDKVGEGKIEILKHTWDNNHILECEIQRWYTRTL